MAENNAGKIMDLVDRKTINGGYLPTGNKYVLVNWDGQPTGEPITTIELSDIELPNQLDRRKFL